MFNAYCLCTRTYIIQMVHIIIVAAILSGFFFNVFLRWRLNEFYWFLLLAVWSVWLTWAKTMRMAAVAYLTSITIMFTCRTSTNSIQQNSTFAAFLKQIFTSTTDDFGLCRSHSVTITIFSFYLINFIKNFSRRSFSYLCHHYFWSCLMYICYIAKCLFWINSYFLLPKYTSKWAVRWRTVTSAARSSMDIYSRLHFIWNFFCNTDYSLLSRRNNWLWWNFCLTSLIF